MSQLGADSWVLSIFPNKAGGSMLTQGVMMAKK